MEKNRSSKVLAVLALCIAVAGLSLGFAAFSNTLTISSEANVTPDPNTFNVDFSSSSSSVEVDPITATTTPGTLTAKQATIDNTNNPKIENLSVTFTEPGQKAVYEFYAYNAGKYLAYLNSISFENVDGENAPKICIAKTNPADGSATTDAYVQQACTAISVSVKVGDDIVATGSRNTINGHSLAIDNSEKIVVTIEYAADGARADGDFDVKFGDIVLTYSSVD